MICVIYRATNLVNGKMYVGQTWDWPNRKKNHEECAIGRGFFTCTYFHAALKKYGIESFAWDVLFEGCASQDALNSIEDDFILENNAIAPNGYNLRLGGSHGKHHEMTKIAISEKRKFQVFSEEAYAKRGDSLRTFYRSSAADELKERYRVARAGKTYEEIYGDDAEREKLKRSVGTAKTHWSKSPAAEEIKRKIAERTKEAMSTECMRDKVSKAQKKRFAKS